MIILIVVLLVLFIGLLVVAERRGNRTLRASADWPAVPGVVVAIERRTTMTPNVGASAGAGLPAGSIMTPSTTTRPIVRYADASGEVHEGRAFRVRGLGRLGVGQHVVVAYDPQLPHRAVIRGVATE